MKILFLKEKTKNEKRVSISPELVSKYTEAGFKIEVESDAGLNSGFLDQDYKNAGAEISTNAQNSLPSADVIVSVQETGLDLSKAKKGSCIVSLFGGDTQKIQTVKDAGIHGFSLELIPRITRAQAMDVLSSQSNLSGYRSVVDALHELDRAAPMMVTAAGTIPALKFMILGAGVAGLQAIATAKRMGAIVCAFDVRAEAKEQVESLGARFVEVQSQETLSGQVYAKEMSEEYKKKQQQVLKDTIKLQDAVITTALIPGKKAPILITEEMVGLMKPGSVIVDLAAQTGGNCALTKPGEIVLVDGVKIIGYENFPSRVSASSSRLFARNVFNFISLLSNPKTGDLNLEDEIIKASLVTSS